MKDTATEPEFGSYTALINLYLNTNFVVYNLDISIKIDKQCEKLNKLLEKHKQTTWAFITAWNPCYNVLSEIGNTERTEMLRSMVCDYTFYEGEGAVFRSKVPDRSLLILGIELKEAMNIGIKLRQIAIVAGSNNDTARLIILNSLYILEISTIEEFNQLCNVAKFNLYMMRKKSDEPKEYDKLLNLWWKKRYIHYNS